MHMKLALQKEDRFTNKKKKNILKKISSKIWFIIQMYLENCLKKKINTKIFIPNAIIYFSLNIMKNVIVKIKTDLKI